MTYFIVLLTIDGNGDSFEIVLVPKFAIFLDVLGITSHVTHSEVPDKVDSGVSFEVLGALEFGTSGTLLKFNNFLELGSFLCTSAIKSKYVAYQSCQSNFEKL